MSTIIHQQLLPPHVCVPLITRHHPVQESNFCTHAAAAADPAPVAVAAAYALLMLSLHAGTYRHEK